jgi:hypothetical protein
LSNVTVWLIFCGVFETSNNDDDDEFVEEVKGNLLVQYTVDLKVQYCSQWGHACSWSLRTKHCAIAAAYELVVSTDMPLTHPRKRDVPTSVADWSVR